jgi:hypothetical protein
LLLALAELRAQRPQAVATVRLLLSVRLFLLLLPVVAVLRMRKLNLARLAHLAVAALTRLVLVGLGLFTATTAVTVAVRALATRRVVAVALVPQGRTGLAQTAATVGSGLLQLLSRQLLRPMSLLVRLTVVWFIFRVVAVALGVEVRRAPADLGAAVTRKIR